MSEKLVGETSRIVMIVIVMIVIKDFAYHWQGVCFPVLYIIKIKFLLYIEHFFRCVLKTLNDNHDNDNHDNSDTPEVCQDLCMTYEIYEIPYRIRVNFASATSEIYTFFRCFLKKTVFLYP